MSAGIQQFQPGFGETSGFVPPWRQQADTTIGNAIVTANHKVTGVVYEPFHIKVVPGTDFLNIWNSERGTNPITFFQFWGAGPFLPLGDVVMPGSANNQTWPSYPDGVMLFAPTPGHSDALAHPIGFQWILDDYRSGNSRDIKYYRLIPPPGYSALGIAFTNGGQPDADRYWCVSNQYLQAIGKAFYWSDDGQHWTKHTGDLWKPAFESGTAPAAPEGKMLLIPPVFLNYEDRGNETGYAIVLESANLGVPAAPAADPTYVAGTTKEGVITQFGLKTVKVVPFTAVADPGYQNQGLSSPFYYIAAEPFWECTAVEDTRAGGFRAHSITVGVAEIQAKAFRESTTISVSAEIGAAYEGAEAKVTASFTREFELTTMTSTAHSTAVQISDQLNYPIQPVTSVWEGRVQIAVYRTNLSQLPPVTYANRSTKFAP